MIKRIGRLLGLLFLIICVFTACEEEVLLFDDEEMTETLRSEEIQSGENPDSEDKTEIMQENVYVHICGAVVSPGVYALADGSRVYDVLNLAGGFDAQADTEAVNLVEELSDGQQVRIPFIGEESGSEGRGLIDINQADVSLLCEIPGIGESRAQAIIDYREEHGSFESVEELMQVPGIKEGLYARIYPYVECWK